MFVKALAWNESYAGTIIRLQTIPSKPAYHIPSISIRAVGTWFKEKWMERQCERPLSEKEEKRAREYCSEKHISEKTLPCIPNVINSTLRNALNLQIEIWCLYTPGSQRIWGSYKGRCNQMQRPPWCAPGKPANLNSKYCINGQNAVDIPSTSSTPTKKQNT